MELPPPPSAQEENKFDFSAYRDIVDIIKNKLLFFFPFFGASSSFYSTKANTYPAHGYRYNYSVASLFWWEPFTQRWFAKSFGL